MASPSLGLEQARARAPMEVTYPIGHWPPDGATLQRNPEGGIKPGLAQQGAETRSARGRGLSNHPRAGPDSRAEVLQSIEARRFKQDSKQPSTEGVSNQVEAKRSEAKRKSASSIEWPARPGRTSSAEDVCRKKLSFRAKRSEAIREANRSKEASARKPRLKAEASSRRDRPRRLPPAWNGVWRGHRGRNRTNRPPEASSQLTCRRPGRRPSIITRA